MFNLFKKEKAFSLIEVLFVIAVIGILASIILVILKEPIYRARDSRIINAIGQIKNFAEMINQEENGYTNLCDGSGAIKTNHDKYKSELTAIDTEIRDNRGTPFCWADSNHYCVYSSLSLLGFFCLDSTGKVVTTAIDPSSSCNGTTFTCP